MANDPRHPMLTVANLALVALALSVDPTNTFDAPRVERLPPAVGPKVAIMCFMTGEQISGMNKICYYDCMGSGAAITVSAVSLCPLSINQ